MDSNKSFGIAGRASNAFTVSRRARGMNIFRAVDSTFVSKVTRKFSVEDFDEIHDTVCESTKEDRECFDCMRSFSSFGVFKSVKFKKDFVYFDNQELAFLERAENYDSLVGLWARPFILGYDGMLYCKFATSFLCLYKGGYASVVLLCDYRRFSAMEDVKKIASLKRFCEMRGLSFMVSDYESGISFKFIVDKYKDLCPRVEKDFLDFGGSGRGDWIGSHRIDKFMDSKGIKFPEFLALCLKYGLSYYPKNEFMEENWLRKRSPLFSAREMMDSLANDYTSLRVRLEEEESMSGGGGFMACEPGLADDCYGKMRKRNGREVFRNVIAFEENGKCGISDRHGNIVIEPIYDDVVVATVTDENEAARIVFVCLVEREMQLFEFDGLKASEIPLKLII